MIGFLCARAGLDLGTANTLLYVNGRGIALSEPSLVTVRTSTGAIEAAGSEAEAGLGRTPGKFRVARPLRTGTISDLALCEGMLHRFLRKAGVPGPLRRLHMALALPGAVTEVHRLAMIESLRNCGAASVLLVDQVLAAARGAGLALEESRGRMVVNIGAGVTEIAVLSLGGTVCTATIHVAGDALDDAVIEYVRAAHQLLIGQRTAERLKIGIGSALPDQTERSMSAKGRCLTRGIPREAVLRDSEIREAISTPLGRIAAAIRQALEHAPPELSADLIETGIVLTGGSALLRNLDQRISRECGLPVKVAQNPLSSVVTGLAHQLRVLRPRDWRRFGRLP